MGTTLGPAELCSVLTFTVNLGHTVPGDQTSSDVNEKKNSVNPPTQYDVAVENLVMGEIKKAYPYSSSSEEESASAGSLPELTDEPTFCMHPIDGITNFVHGFPFCCISLGLIYQKCPALGVVYNPFIEYQYTRIEGQGSYLALSTGQPQKLPPRIPKAPPLPIQGSNQYPVEWGSDRGTPVTHDKAGSFLKPAGDSSVPGEKMAQSLRSMGSAALNFPIVVQGALDLYW
ncbi:carbohydrate phosphatase [Imleria badia]|nr:carbohydrate phosphatase [Imleria badia]